jgi:hypothetical protein
VSGKDIIEVVIHTCAWSTRSLGESAGKTRMY